MENEEKPSITVLEEVEKLFNKEISKAFADEDISDEESLGELLIMDGTADIFRKLKLNFGKVIKLKNHFKTILERKQLEAKKVLSVPKKSKPTMALLESRDPELKALYLKNRKKVGQLASKRWGDQCRPKFNNPKARIELEEFAREIADEVAIPEIGFDVQGIIQHVRDFFNEQRRHQKRCSSQDSASSQASSQDSFESSPECKVMSRKRSRMSSPPLPCMIKEHLSPKVSTKVNDQSSSDEEEASTADTVILSEDENREDSKDDKVPVPDHLGSRVVKLIIKIVCGTVVQDREKLVQLLNSKFSVQKQNMAKLSHSELSQVLAKKLIKHGYIEVENAVPIESILKSDIIVKKEIQM